MVGARERDRGVLPPLRFIKKQEVVMQNRSMSESAVRARARRMGFEVRKSRDRSIHMDNLGDFMLVNAAVNGIVLGSRYNATLEEITEYLDN